MDTREQHRAFELKGHIQRGDMAPWWNQGLYKFIFDPCAGRYIVLGFCGSVDDAIGQNALHALHKLRRFVADEKACFFCVSKGGPEYKTERDVRATFSSVQFVWDADATMSRAYGIGSGRIWIVLNPMLRVIEVIPFRTDGADVLELSTLIENLPPSKSFDFEMPPPVLILPDVFEPEFCRHLIGSYERHGGRESGFMAEVAGKAVEHYDPAWKRRKDYIITDETLIDQIKARMSRRVGPMLQRAFHFKLTRMERHLVACYAAEDGGHFGPHRDDTVKATEHRRFAVSINLNDDFGGGELRFPEFGSRLFKAPVGAALIFSSSLLHCVSKVTVGRRYAFLPFLHDEEAERIRLANLQFLARQPASTGTGALAI